MRHYLSRIARRRHYMCRISRKCHYVIRIPRHRHLRAGSQYNVAILAKSRGVGIIHDAREKTDGCSWGNLPERSFCLPGYDLYPWRILFKVWRFSRTFWFPDDALYEQNPPHPTPTPRQLRYTCKISTHRHYVIWLSRKRQNTIRIPRQRHLGGTPKRRRYTARFPESFSIRC